MNGSLSTTVVVFQNSLSQGYLSTPSLVLPSCDPASLHLSFSSFCANCFVFCFSWNQHPSKGNLMRACVAGWQSLWSTNLRKKWGETYSEAHRPLGSMAELPSSQHGLTNPLAYTLWKLLILLNSSPTSLSFSKY